MNARRTQPTHPKTGRPEEPRRAVVRGLRGPTRSTVLLGLLAMSCEAPSLEAPPAQDEDMSAPSRFVTVTKPRSQSLLEAPAKVVGATPGVTALTVLHRARIVKFHVAPGDRVQRGTPIVDLVMPDLTEAAARSDALRARLGAAAGRLSALEKLKSEGLARAAQLFEMQELVARLRAELASTKAMLRTYTTSDRARRRLVKTGILTLESPDDGLIVDRHGRTGATIEASDPPLVTIAAPREARIEASLVGPVPSAGRLTFVGQDGRAVALRLEPLSTYRDGQSGRMVAWFAPQPAVQLVDGLAGRIVIAIPEDAVEVPSQALRKTDGRTEVALLEGARPRWVGVQVLIDSGTSAVVRGGLEVGARVAADARGLAR